MTMAIMELESTLTDRYQTTVPETVRKALGLGKKDKIRYTLQPNGQVVLSRADQSSDDPLIENFLCFLARDMSQNPEHIQPINTKLVDEVQSLVANVQFDLDEMLPDEDE